MVDRVVGQLSLADGLAHATPTVLDQIARVIDWAPIRALLGTRSGPGSGNTSYPAEPLLRCLLLGVWHRLSDPALEEQLRDCLSFRRFAGFSLTDRTPDHSTLWRFRAELSRDGLITRVFDEITRQFEIKGLILKHGTLVDATFLPARARPPAKPKQAAETPASETSQSKAKKRKVQSGAETKQVQPPPAADQTSQIQGETQEIAAAAAGAPATDGAETKPRVADPDARWGKKGGKSVFGYKLHLGVDQTHTLIRRIVTTDASVPDTGPADVLISGDERAVYGDQAYYSHARHARLQAAGIKDRLMRRPNKHHSELPPRQKRRNRLIAKVRAAVERPFAVLKERYGMRRLRFFSGAANATQCVLACCGYNLRRAAGVLFPTERPA
ncbi:IS5 family transposase [Microvirga massiliensis]|uniref:IS5 family transposase n=1 Tax=Microvirga massiliensis TaxID=1033741 RepID=UPI00069C2F1B|nr:IS5 family transposase [Microvirga massiliensis]